MDGVSNHGFEVAIIGATGCVGRELVQRVGEVLPIRKLHLFASLSSTAERIDVEGESLVVKGLSEDGIPSEIRAGIHAVLLCCPPELAEKWGPELAEEGIAVIDMTGALGKNIGYSLTGLSDREEDFQSHRMVSLPAPSTSMLARVWQTLHAFKPIQMSSVISVSASRFGQSGIDELAKQVRGLLNFQDAPQVVFPDGLAFDILPTMDDVQSAPLTNQQISETMADLTLLEPHRFRNRLQVAPIFSGISIHAQISLGVTPTAEGFGEVLAESEWVEFRNALPTLRTTTGYPDVLIGHVEMNPWIQGVELQVQADNVALAVHNALTVLNRLNTMELL